MTTVLHRNKNPLRNKSADKIDENEIIKEESFSPFRVALGNGSGIEFRIFIKMLFFLCFWLAQINILLKASRNEWKIQEQKTKKLHRKLYF